MISESQTGDLRGDTEIRDCAEALTELKSPGVFTEESVVTLGRRESPHAECGRVGCTLPLPLCRLVTAPFRCLPSLIALHVVSDDESVAEIGRVEESVWRVRCDGCGGACRIGDVTHFARGRVARIGTASGETGEE